MRSTCAIGVVAALLACAAPARAASLPTDMQKLVDAGAPGVIVLARDGSHTLRLATGVADRAHHKPMRITDRFRIGSLTKTFVAAVVLQLAGEGKLSLDDSVEKWVPGLVPGGGAITVRQLLNHTSGLFDYLNDGDGTVLKPYLKGDLGYVWTPRALVGVATKHPARFKPGAGWSYSNTGYIVLGLVVEAATGDSLAAELRKRLIVPLGLHRTSLDASPRIAGRHAHGYYRFGRKPLIDVTGVSPTLAWAAGGIVSTVGDVAQFYRALLQGHVLRAEELHAMQMTVSMGVDGEDYGLGLWETRSLGFEPTFRLSCADRVWGHDGDFPGYLTYAFNSADGRRQAVVAINDDALSKRGARAVAQVVGTAYCAA
ncbi:MAG TPA: serine hydrolase domain-containing protein [Solirubrobacteraceae bacterium]|jgi:D-alanyl-D-alanine carboxypeptidase